VLIHGAATTSRVWRQVVPLLDGFEVLCPDRPCRGDLAIEVGTLAPICREAVLAGVSGGATLGLALAAAGVPFAAALLHEPAVGSLLPGLLEPFRAAYADGGPDAFGAALYGPAWTSAEAPDDPAAVGRDLAMFRGFEPAAPAPGAGAVVVTVGECSPPVRHESVRRLSARFGLPTEVLPGAGHAVHLEQPEAFAAAVRRLAGNTACALPAEGGGQARELGVLAGRCEHGEAVRPPGLGAAARNRDRGQVQQVGERGVVAQHGVQGDRIFGYLRDRERGRYGRHRQHVHPVPGRPGLRPERL
jgi:hypothetical protein